MSFFINIRADRRRGHSCLAPHDPSNICMGLRSTPYSSASTCSETNAGDGAHLEYVAAVSFLVLLVKVGETGRSKQLEATIP